ncbi:hypothetical protein CPC08DRAFT_750073 [Agrocybe pediades]|nr:hypothetical protein CPC08DRAFT_750073 [Agrocybe pediades]
MLRSLLDAFKWAICSVVHKATRTIAPPVFAIQANNSTTPVTAIDSQQRERWQPLKNLVFDGSDIVASSSSREAAEQSTEYICAERQRRDHDNDMAILSDRVDTPSESESDTDDDATPRLSWFEKGKWKAGAWPQMPEETRRRLGRVRRVIQIRPRPQGQGRVSAIKKRRSKPAIAVPTSAKY